MRCGLRVASCVFHVSPNPHPEAIISALTLDTLDEYGRNETCEGHPASPRRKQNNEEIVNGLYGIFQARPAEMPEYAVAANYRCHGEWLR